MYKTLSRRRLTGLDLPLFGNQDDRPDYRTHMRYDARKLDHRLSSLKKKAPLGGRGRTLVRGIPQKYFSLFIGGKDENV